MALATIYAMVLGERAYPFNAILFLIAVVASAWMFDWVASVTAIASSVLILAYFCVPPLYSFRTSQHGVALLMVFAATAAAIGAIIHHRKGAVKITAASAAASFGGVPALKIEWTCDSDGAVLSSSPEWRAFVGEGAAQGFRWLASVHPSDRNCVIDLLAGKVDCIPRCRLRGVNGQYAVFSIGAEAILQGFSKRRAIKAVELA